ncbi:MAG: GNAT family N-acetyltransferase [Candidatus Hodarchaeota archaeon]
MPPPQPPTGLQIRNMQFSDFDFIVELFRSLSWTTTRQDLETLLLYDPCGCFVAELKGEQVGSVTTTKYTHFGWVGMLLVKEALRRRRIGTTLMKTAIRYLFDEGMSTVNLEADPSGVPLYEYLDFQKEYDSLRWYREGPSLPQTTGIRQATLDDIHLLFPLDRRAFGDERSRLLTLLFECSRFTLVLEDKPECGMLMARDSPHGTIFGPFIADSIVVADQLLQAGLSLQKSQTVIVGIPSTHQEAISLLKRYGFECKAVLSRMFLGKEPTKGDSSLEYGIGTSATG